MPDRVRFGWETLAVLLEEPNVRELITDYWRELWPFPDIPVEVDWPRLLGHEAAGIYKVWTARVNGTLAGFVSFYVQPHIMSRNVVMAIDGGHFLAPAFRNRHDRLGWRMWRTAKAALKAEGVKVWQNHDNAARPLMPFFLALDMEPRSVIFWGRP